MGCDGIVDDMVGGLAAAAEGDGYVWAVETGCELAGQLDE
jgi:hypothetical protein